MADELAKARLVALGERLMESLRPLAEAWVKFGNEAAARTAARATERRRLSRMHAMYRRRKR